MKSAYAAALMLLFAGTVPANAASGPEITISSTDVTSVKIAFSKKYPIRLEIKFNWRKARQVYDLLDHSLGKTVQIKIGDSFVSEVTVKATGKTLRHFPFTVDTKNLNEALRLAKLLMGQK
ncbi:MAG: hypothetical protein KGM24_14545 [Elusimicrobia bacterium]|nr:hypothetical protein [Elusimicrobiota bacterium]